MLDGPAIYAAGAILSTTGGHADLHSYPLPWVVDFGAHHRELRLADGPAQAYAQTKALLTREQDMSLSAALELEAVTQALLMTGQDYAEFHAAFTAGREPHWQGR